MQNNTTNPIPGFQIIQKIGQGSTSVVYKAVQLSMQRTVAIKILLPSLATNVEIQKRFVFEARAVAKLSHQNIIKGINVGRAGNLIYFVMEHVEGLTGLQLIQKNKKVSEKETVSITKQIAKALKHADKHGMIHKDIKPENILVTPNGIAKLCDLGLAAKQLDAEQISGTPYYISPEQAQGDKNISIKSDIYSLGVTAYHLATGKVPFGGTPTVVMSKHLTMAIPHLKRLVPELTDRFCNIIMKMLEKNPTNRYDPTEVIENLTLLKYD